jgi:protein-S-isoprenylcysteine O-methyltransferase Ste14
MSADSAHTRWWQIFEVVFGIPLLAAIALQRAAPLALPRGTLTPAVLPSGVALIVAGAAIVILARREFARHGQPTDPGRPTGAVVTTGVFSFSRNPLYLGGVFILVGIALVFDLAWLLVLLLPALIACHYVLIAPEERYLAAKFGEEYRAYAASVHRWIGPARRGTSPPPGRR